MTFRGAYALLVAIAFATAASADSTSSASRMHVPAGFFIEPVALPPLVQRPMMGGFDERGRLFVTESAGLNLAYDKLRENPPNSIRMLEDTDGDGTFDKSTVFADHMTFPTGALWHDGALYACSAPSLWKLEDTNGDGVCDRRSEIVTGFGSSGNGADLHGPFLGPDGWLYFADGRNGHDLTMGDGTKWTGKAAAVYRCRTDGTGLQVAFGGGMDNPVEAVFTPQGEMLVSCNLVMARPQRLDGILYGIDGGVYPYDAALAEFPRTGDLLKPVGDLGWVAVSGLTRFEGTSFGEDFNGNLFATLFNRHGVQRLTVARDGAGFRIVGSDFLTGNDVDFHPTDVLQDADGSLIVIDTGGWFRIGCPVSQQAKPNELGGIYRIRRADAKRMDDPRGLKLKWNDVAPAELVARLRDSRPVVAQCAADVLAKSDGAAHEIEDLAAHEKGWVATRALWILMRRDTVAARASVRRAIENPDTDVRRTAIRAAGLGRDREALPMLLRTVASEDLAESREAALALARTPDKSTTAALLSRLGRATDPFHVHALTLALLHTGDRDGIVKGLADRSGVVRRAALVALDQMSDGNLTFEQIAPLLATNDGAVRGEAMTVVTKHPEWAAHVAKEIGDTSGKPDELRSMAIAFAPDSGVQGAISDVIRHPATPAATKVALLDAIASAAVPELPAGWNDAVGEALRGSNDDVTRAAIDVVRSRSITTFDDRLLAIARDAHRGDELRVAALAAVAPRMAPSVQDFAFLIAQLDSARPPLARMSAARSLGGMTLDDAQLTELAAAVASAGPLEVNSLLAAFEKSKSAAVGNALVAALDKSRAAKGLNGAAVRAALQNFPAAISASAEPLLKRLDAGDADRAARLAELGPLTSGGDPSRGQSVFLGKTASCTICHVIAGAGGQVGPDLSKIGALRSRRDLLESIVFPSASIARGFEPFVVETIDGNVYAGTLVSDSGDAIRLKTPAEVTIPRSQMKSFRPDRVSIMPQGLDAQLSKQELADLLAFLAACK